MPRMRLSAFVLLVLLGVGTIGLSADELRGRVVAIADGDTLTLLDAGKKQYSIRLNGIDAPETGQAFSQVAKANLSTLVFGHDVVVVWSKVDDYGRLVGTVLRGTLNANLEQLRAGLAWYFRRYEADVAPENRPLYAAAEAEAKSARRGLWQDATPTAPWTFRGDASSPAATTATTPSRPLGLLSPATSGRVIGNRRSGIYHVPGCRNYNDIAERNRVYFNTEAEARAAGFRKAQNCN